MTTLSAASPAVYYLSYGVTENTSDHIRATFGNLHTDDHSHRRILDVDLRVGSHQLDNTHGIRGVAFEMGRGTRGVFLPVGNDVTALRQVIWRSTDQAYRSAAERYEKVTTNLKVKVKEEDSSADMSTEAALVYFEEQPHSPLMLQPGEKRSEKSPMCSENSLCYTKALPASGPSS